MRQTVRLDEVRAPRTPTDTLGADQVQGLDGTAETLDAHYNGVLTQLKNALGTETWRDAPPGTLADLSGFRSDAEAKLAAQNEAITAQNQALSAQAQSITALAQAAQDVSALRAAVQAVQTNLANLNGATARQSDFSALSAQLNALDTALTGQVATLTAQVAALAGQAATDSQRLSTLETNAKTYVTASGLAQALTTAYRVDQPLTGVQNRINLIFTTPSPFVAGTLRVHYNGQALRQGPGGDYIVASSQPGVPYDQIRFLHAEAAPCAQDVLTATYIPA